MWLPKFVIPTACLVLASVSGCSDMGSFGPTPTSGAPEQSRGNSPPTGPTPTSGAPEQSRGNSPPTVEADSDKIAEVGGNLVVEPHFQCGPSEPGRGFPRGFLSWTADGTHLVFNHFNRVWRVDREGSQLHDVLDANPEPASFRGQYFFVYWFAADVSPDDSQIAYTSCQFPTEYEQSGVSLDSAAALLAKVGADWYDRGKYQYEIAVSGIDGDNQKRLTRNLRLDHYPVWSPNGEDIAFISSLEDLGDGFIVSHFRMRLHRVGLFVMSTDGSDVRQVAPQLKSIALTSPKWSPDGQRLAVIVNEGERLLQDVQALYIVKSDGSEVRRIGEAAAVPAAWSPDSAAVPAAWSPDSEELAFASVDGESQIIYAVKPDGTDLRTIWRRESDKAAAPIFQVLWSPDGSELLFLSDGAYLVRQDGSDLRLLPAVGTRAAWSPDGSRIAIYEPGHFQLDYTLYAMSRDGTDLRVLVEKDANGNLVPVSPTE